jgi:hypothetical protein
MAGAGILCRNSFFGDDRYDLYRQCDRLSDCPPLSDMEGYTNDETAAKLGCVPRTVGRQLRLIRLARDNDGTGYARQLRSAVPES